MAQSPRLFELLVSGETLILVTHGNLGEFQFHEIELEAQPILQHLDRGPTRHVVVDLKATDYCGSAALAFLLKVWKRVSAHQGRMALCNLSPTVRDVLTATRTDSIWPLRDSREAALVAVSGGPA